MTRAQWAMVLARIGTFTQAHAGVIWDSGRTRDEVTYEEFEEVRREIIDRLLRAEHTLRIVSDDGAPPPRESVG